MDIRGPNSDLLLRLMTASSDRMRVIAGNLSNQNTPGYQRREVEFEALLQEELESGTPDLSSIHAQTVIDTETPSRADGNNVNAEMEVSSMRENLMRYQLYATIMRGQSKLLQSAIHGDR